MPAVFTFTLMVCASFKRNLLEVNGNWDMLPVRVPDPHHLATRRCYAKWMQFTDHLARSRLSLPFADALKAKKSKAVNGKPKRMATTPAPTECHLIQPNAKSTTAQTVKKAMGFRRFIPAVLSSTWRWQSNPPSNPPPTYVIGFKKVPYFRSLGEVRDALGHPHSCNPVPILIYQR